MLVLVVSKEQAFDGTVDGSLARVCHDFDATTVGDLEVAIELAAKSATRQLRRARDVFVAERDRATRRAAFRSV